MHQPWGSATRWIALLQPELIDVIVILSVSARAHVFKQQPLSHAEDEKTQQKEVPSHPCNVGTLAAEPHTQGRVCALAPTALA